MDIGTVLSGIALGVILTAAALYAYASLASLAFGAGEVLKQAAMICGAVGVVIMLVSSMATTRTSDRSMSKPPVYGQPPGYANPNPGGNVPFDHTAGMRPEVPQFPAPVGEPVTITVQGDLSVTGRLGGTVSAPGVGLGVESGAQTAVVAAK